MKRDIQFDLKYYEKVLQFLNKLSMNGIVIVFNVDSTKYEWCKLACSIGIRIGNWCMGLIFVNRDFLTNIYIPEELKDFVIAHEVSHIAFNHFILKFLIRFLTENLLQVLKEIIESLGEEKNLIKAFLNFLAVLVLTIKMVEVDRETIRQQELQADEMAIKLAGYKGALIFCEMLEKLKSKGFSVSHEDILGFPALTIDERIKFIRQKCESLSFM